MAEPSATPKRCLYEVLGVARDCTQDEIRAAYKRRALQLHPDKLASSNPGLSPAAATAAFQELLHAYEVLSDPRERAWYDSHRSHILFASPASNSKASSPFDLDLFSFFSPSAFSGYSDSGCGFYKVYADLFSKLYNQELYFCSQLGLNPDSVPPMPLMGNLDSPYSQVSAFYNYWLGFSTVMDFGWVDEYDASVGPNRRSRRAMEEANKKARKVARREYNDTVRGLAAYVKKRDKRVIDMQVKKKLEEQKRREEEQAKRKEVEKKKAERARMYEEPEWAKIDDDVEELALGGGYYEGEDVKRKNKEKGGEEFYCVVCNKKFKSDKQWKNHEQSKKHREKVVELRDVFKEEDEVLPEEDGDVDDYGEGVRVEFDYIPAQEDEDSDAVDKLNEDFKDELELEENGGVEDAGEEKLGLVVDNDDDDDDDGASILEAMVSGRKNKVNNHLGSYDTSPNKDSHVDNGEQIVMENDMRRKSRRNQGRRRTNSKDDKDGEAMRGETSEVCQDDAQVQDQEHNAGDAKAVISEEVAARSKGDRAAGKNQKPKKQLVKVEGRKMDMNIESKNSSKGRKQKGTSKVRGNACETCGESFDSRNKLFEHLGDTGHAALKSR